MHVDFDLVAVPIAFLNELNALAALVLVRGADFLSLVDQPQRDALAMLFLNLRGYGFDVAGIFGAFGFFRLGCWCTGRAFFRASGGVADAELLRVSDQQFTRGTATVRGTGPPMDAPVPLWRTGVHALATDHGCKAKAGGESSLLCSAFIRVLKTCGLQRV